MEIKINIDYSQILDLIHQLPEEDISRLLKKLNSENKIKNTNLIQELLLNAPTWTDSDLNNYYQARDHINNSRLI